MEKQYIPFGEEWKQEMRKWTKDLLVEALKKALIKNMELEEKLKTSLPFTPNEATAG